MKEPVKYPWFWMGLGIVVIGVANAHVFDVEPSNPANEYAMEKEIFDRSNDSWSREFPSFEVWLDERESSFSALNTKIKEFAIEAGEYAVESIMNWGYTPECYERSTPDSLDRAEP